MSLLKSEPPESVRSFAELFAIAYALEDEAAARYRELATRMREHGAPATAAVFEHLAGMEREHRDRVTGWSQRESGKVPDIADIRWHIPPTFDDEMISEMDVSRLVTPYRALSMAVRNEERAFAFWAYVAGKAEDATVRGAAEAMAREELEHVALLRRERRRAYHAAKSGQATPERRLTAREVLAEAAALEICLAEQLERLRSTRSSEVQVRIGELARQSREMAADAGDANASRLAGSIEVADDDMEELLASAEYLVERYLDAAERAADDATLNLAQSLARRAITRLTSMQAIDRRAPAAR